MATDGLLSFTDAMDRIVGGDEWVRPVSWRGSGRFVSSSWGRPVRSAKSQWIKDYTPGPERDERWEVVSTDTICAERGEPPIVSKPEMDVLETTERFEGHGMSYCPEGPLVSVAEWLCKCGFLRSMGYVQVCDGDGWALQPEREAVGYVLTRNGHDRLKVLREHRQEAHHGD